jgi:hypothetical protein
MQLINTDGMALIGPGSEWFWTALTGLILTVTFFAIYRQLSIARSAASYEQLTAFEREQRSERMLRNGLDILVALRAGVDPAHVPLAPAVSVAGFWEMVGGLARRRHLDPNLLWQGSGNECATWWVALAPFARTRRAAVGPTQYEHFEWLAGVMSEFDRRAGARTTGEASLAAEMEMRIGLYRDLLRVEEALRSSPAERSPGPVPVVPAVDEVAGEAKEQSSEGDT